MKLRTAFSWMLIIFAIGFTVFVFIRPILKPQAEFVKDTELIQMGYEKETGQTWYIVFKEEAKEWVQIITQASPLLAALLAYGLKRKKAD